MNRAILLQTVMALALSSLAGHAGALRNGSARQIDPDDYQVFVGGWEPSTAPFCAAIEDPSEWAKILHPAAVMEGNKPFAPPAAFWKDHAVLLIARETYGGADLHRIFTLKSVRRFAASIDMNVDFAPPPASSYTVRWFMAVSVKKPLPVQIRFDQNDARTCSIAPGTAHWASPHLPAD